MLTCSKCRVLRAAPYFCTHLECWICKAALGNVRGLSGKIVPWENAIVVLAACAMSCVAVMIYSLLLCLSSLFWSDTYSACSPRAKVGKYKCTNGTKSRAWDRWLRFNDRWRYGEETALRVACALSNTDYCKAKTEGLDLTDHLLY